jgi:hypothetical protein
MEMGGDRSIVLTASPILTLGTLSLWRRGGQLRASAALLSKRKRRASGTIETGRVGTRTDLCTVKKRKSLPQLRNEPLLSSP